MSYRIVDAAAVSTGRGPHPAASVYDKRISEYLGIIAFEVYQVELPAHAETVLHTHTNDQVEDTYAFVRGSGWLVVDDDRVPVAPGQFAAGTVADRPMTRPINSAGPAPRRIKQ